MNRRSLVSPAVALLLLPFALIRAADPLPQSIRFTEAGEKATLETAIASFRAPSGQEVDLISAVHIADPEYFAELNQRFESYDAVLFEMVGGKDTMTREELASRPSSAVGTFQKSIKDILHLQFQLDGIRYDRENMVHADMSREEFTAEQGTQNESLLQLILNASKENKLQLLESPESTPKPILLSDVFRTISSPDIATELKFIVARQLANAEGLIAGLENKNSSVILSGRNKIVLKKLTDVLKKEPKRVAIFYGGAHMPGIGLSLTSDFGMKHTGTTWIPAWSLQRPQPQLIPASGE